MIVQRQNSAYDRTGSNHNALQILLRAFFCLHIQAKSRIG